MAKNIVALPYGYFPDPGKGRPLASADIYVGIIDLDPKIPGNQKTVTLRQEDGTEVPTSQPINTGAGGVPLLNGSPVQLVVDGAYSIRVDNKNGGQEYYAANVTKGNPLTADSGITAVIDMIGLIAITGHLDTNMARMADFYSTRSGGGGGFIWESGTSKTTHDGVYFIDPDIGITPGDTGWNTAVNSGNGVWVRITIETKTNVKWGGAKGDLSQNEDELFQFLLDNFTNIYTPGGDYWISTELFLAADTADYQADPESKYFTGEGEITKFHVADGIPMISGTQSGTSTDWNFFDFSMETKDADKVTYDAPLTTMSSFAVGFNVSADDGTVAGMRRCRFERLTFEFIKPFFQDNATYTVKGRFVQQMDILNCESTHHQEWFYDAENSLSVNIIRNRIERGNRAIKSRNANAYANFKLNIRENTIQGNGWSSSSQAFCNWFSPSYHLSIEDNYLEANRYDDSGTTKPLTHIRVEDINAGVKEKSRGGGFVYKFNGNYMAQPTVNLSNLGIDYWHISFGELNDELVMEGDLFNGGNGLEVSTDGSVSGFVEIAEVGAGGTGYTVGDVLTITGGGGSGATLTVVEVNSGIVTGIKITTEGTDYITTNGAATSGGTGTGCTINITADTNVAQAFFENCFVYQRGADTTEGKFGDGTIPFFSSMESYKPVSYNANWTPVISDEPSGGNPASITVARAKVEVQDEQVTVHARINNIDTSGMTAVNTLYIQGLPFRNRSTFSAYVPLFSDNLTFAGYVLVAILEGRDYLVLKDIVSGGVDSEVLVSAVNSGVTDLGFSLSYFK